jgi:hypothetical protein
LEPDFGFHPVNKNLLVQFQTDSLHALVTAEVSKDLLSAVFVKPDTRDTELGEGVTELADDYPLVN